MIKKLLLTALIGTTIGSLTAQSSRTKLQTRSLDESAFTTMRATSNSNNQQLRTSTIATYQDTLWYFYSKQKFKNLPANQLFYTVQAAVSTNTAGNLVEFGSSFLNGVSPAGDAVTVKGAYILASRQTNSNPAGIPIKLYLYNATGAGVPTTKVDSALATITNTNGSFSYVAFTTPHTVSGSFFVSYRNISISSTDTLLGWMNAATTATSTNPTSTKFGESLSFTRYVDPTTNQLFSNTNFYGSGLDIEATVLPVVSFSINANYTITAAPNATSTPGAYCAATPIPFSNITTPAGLMYNRQFNFNKFIPYWAPYSFTITPNVADSINNWAFTTGPVVYTKNATVSPAVTPAFNATLTMKYRPSPRGTVQYPSVSDAKVGTAFPVVSCGPLGIQAIAGFENFNVYPNPAINGKTNLTGLAGSNTISVYNLVGQLISTQTTTNETSIVDLSSQPNGSYFVKITNSNNITKTVKIINQ